MLNSQIIGGKIADARKKLHLSQAELARQLFISPQAVGKWERGESIPDIVTLNRLAKIVQVDLNYFSDDFQSAAGGAPASEPVGGHSAKHPPERHNSKRGWDMSLGNWTDADFSGLKNLNEKFASSNMQRCKFVGSDMSGLLLKNNNVDSCDFSASDISCSHIQRSNLLNNIFKDSSLKEAEFSRSYIMGCDFTGADLTDATLSSGGFQSNQMVNTLLHRTSFVSMHVIEMVFDGILEDCSFENCSFKKVTFQNATLVNTFFKNNSLKGIRFVDCQADRMTYEFLKNGKADLSGVTLLAE